MKLFYLFLSLMTCGLQTLTYAAAEEDYVDVPQPSRPLSPNTVAAQLAALQAQVAAQQEQLQVQAARLAAQEAELQRQQQAAVSNGVPADSSTAGGRKSPNVPAKVEREVKRGLGKVADELNRWKKRDFKL